MATITARVDEQAKINAEKIADSIGISLSTAINIFLNKFVAERGFPFAVTAPKNTETIFEKDKIEEMFITAIRENADKIPTLKSAYIDPTNHVIKKTE